MAVKRHHRAKWFDDPLPRGWKPREYGLVVVRLSDDEFALGCVRSGVVDCDGRYLVRVNPVRTGADGRNTTVEKIEQLIHIDDLRPLRRPMTRRITIPQDEGESS